MSDYLDLWCLIENPDYWEVTNMSLAGSLLSMTVSVGMSCCLIYRGEATVVDFAPQRESIDH
jgi:hypothetical protein